MATLLLASALTPALAACRPVDARETAESLAANLRSRAYPRIYSLLSTDTRDDITLTALSQRYEDIYGALGLTQSDCTVKSITALDANHSTALMTLSLESEKLGQFQLELEVPMVREGRAWRVQWSSELILPGLEDGCRALIRTVPAKRGEIFDANGKVLARNDFAQSVYVDTSRVTNYETLIRLLAPELGMTEDAVRKKLATAINTQQGESEESIPTDTPDASPAATPTAPAAIESNKPQVAMMYVIKSYPRDTLSEERQQQLKAIDGVGIDSSYMTPLRLYPYGNTLAHVLGYTSVASAEDLADPANAGITQDALIGKSGLEKAYELQLRGKPGSELVILDEDNNTKLTLARQPKQDGLDLRLTIDIRMQQRAELQLMEHLSDQMSGTVIVLDPKTGYIQAMASAPSFDPNLFSFAIDEQTWKTLQDPKSQNPLYNRATAGLYPPGSTFKPFTAAMGLEDHAISTSFEFTGKIVDNLWTPDDDNWIYPPIRRVEATPGALNLRNAMTYSDNIFFAYTAMKVGGPAFLQHCMDLGIGAKMNFELPLATGQVVNGEKFETLRTLADSGYGQGEMLITPLKMASLFSSLANSGDIMLPRLVQALSGTAAGKYGIVEARPPEVWREDVIADDIVNVLVDYLKRVVTDGTGDSLNRPSLRNYELGAKTGTAEVGTDKSREVAWLIAFATEQVDRLVCTAIEVPAGKGGVRSNIMFNMLQPLPALSDISDEDLQKIEEEGENVLNGE